MTEQNPGNARPKASAFRKIGLTVAMVAAPVGAYALYQHLEDATEKKNSDLEKSFAYDLSAMKQIDPALIKYREVRQIDPAMSNPQAIAIDAQGNLLVAGGKQVRRLSATGMPMGEFVAVGEVVCITPGSDGRVFVGLIDHVEVYSGEGKLLANWQAFSPRSRLTSIAVASNGDVFVADQGNERVWRCDGNGKVINEIGRADAARGYEGLRVPSPHMDLAIGADGLLWVANPGRHRLEAYSPDGTLERYWGDFGTVIESFPGCCNPADFVLMVDGSFITAEKGVARVKRYLNDGRFESVVAAPAAFSENMTGLDLAGGADGLVYVLERGARQVRVFEREARHE